MRQILLVFHNRFRTRFLRVCLMINSPCMGICQLAKFILKHIVFLLNIHYLYCPSNPKICKKQGGWVYTIITIYPPILRFNPLHKALASMCAPPQQDRAGFSSLRRCLYKQRVFHPPHLYLFGTQHLL